MLHAEFTAALWVLTGQRLRVRALPTAMAVPLSGSTRRRLKRLTAMFILASQQYSLSLSRVHAVRGAILLPLARRFEVLPAVLALMAVMLASVVALSKNGTVGLVAFDASLGKRTSGSMGRYR